LLKRIALEIVSVQLNHIESVQETPIAAAKKAPFFGERGFEFS
jgi:hypothetical protein